MASEPKKPTRQQWDKNSMTMAILAIKEHRMGYKSPERKPDTPKATNIPNVLNASKIAEPSTSSSYLSPKQLFPVPNIRKKSSNRGRKATKSTFLTSSPYKLDLETSIKTKQEAEALKKKKNITKMLEETKNTKKK